MPLSPTGAELLFEVFSQRCERGSIIVTSNLPFEEWTSVFGSERLTGALLDRLNIWSGARSSATLCRISLVRLRHDLLLVTLALRGVPSFHNMSMMAHPMHLHGHVFQVVVLNG